MTNNDAFRANFARLIERAGSNAHAVVRRTALELQSQMISRSPVDTGRFKGNWQAGTGATNDSTSDEANSDALGRTAAVLQGWKPGQTIYLTNSMPYALRFENGWSKQAPTGMVRLSVQNYSQAIAKALGEVK